MRRAWFNLLIPVPVLGPRLLGRGRQRLPRWMLRHHSSAREAFAAEDVELFVGRLREPSRARAGSALYRHFIQPEAARIMTGSYRGRRLGTPTLVLLGADVERGIELFNRRSVDRGLREWTAEDVRAGKQTLTEEFEAVSEPDLA